MYFMLGPFFTDRLRPLSFLPGPPTTVVTPRHGSLAFGSRLQVALHFPERPIPRLNRRVLGPPPPLSH